MYITRKGKSQDQKISKGQVREQFPITEFLADKRLLEMLEGRLREGFVRIRQLMVSSHPHGQSRLLIEIPGPHTSRNPPPRTLQSLTILRSYRWLRALFRIPRRSPAILPILPPPLHPGQRAGGRKFTFLSP